MIRHAVSHLAHLSDRSERFQVFVATILIDAARWEVRAHLMFQASSTSTPFASALTARRESGGRRKTPPLELVSSILFVTCSHEKGIDPCNTTRNISCVTLLQLSFVYNSDADHEVLLAVPFRNLRLNRNRLCPPDATSCLCCFGSFHHPAPSCCRSH